jgi:hypothetical protein
MAYMQLGYGYFPEAIHALLIVKTIEILKGWTLNGKVISYVLAAQAAVTPLQRVYIERLIGSSF